MPIFSKTSKREIAKSKGKEKAADDDSVETQRYIHIPQHAYSDALTCTPGGNSQITRQRNREALQRRRERSGATPSPVTMSQNQQSSTSLTTHLTYTSCNERSAIARQHHQRPRPPPVGMRAPKKEYRRSPLAISTPAESSSSVNEPNREGETPEPNRKASGMSTDPSKQTTAGSSSESASTKSNASSRRTVTVQDPSPATSLSDVDIEHAKHASSQQTTPVPTLLGKIETNTSNKTIQVRAIKLDRTTTSEGDDGSANSTDEKKKRKTRFSARFFGFTK